MAQRKSFGCSDSRLAAEIIFDRGLGDLFVVRTAGNVAGAEVLGSIEYGVSVLDVRSLDEEILDEHIRHTVDLLLDRARVLAERVAAGRLGVVGLSYRLPDGSAQLVASRGLDAAVPAAS